VMRANGSRTRTWAYHVEIVLCAFVLKTIQLHNPTLRCMGRGYGFNSSMNIQGCGLRFQQFNMYRYGTNIIKLRCIQRNI
jgi:hypothetical protein